MPPPFRAPRTHAPAIQDIIPNFDSNFKADYPFFYFLHKIDPERATLTVEVIGPNLTFTFTHSHVLNSNRFNLSTAARGLESKTVGFLSIVKGKEDRHVLAWAESGHGLGRLGDMLDAPEGSPVLSSELWTRRVIHVGNILGIRMARGYDNMRNAADPSLDINGIFQGSHVEVKLAVHAIWLMLAVFNITKDLNHVTKKHLKKLRDVKWADGTRPRFEVYFSRKNCGPCGNIVRGLSELTGIEIQLLWKDRVTMKEYYKRPKTKQQARTQEKAFLRQDDLADFDDVVVRRAEEDGYCSTDNTVMSDADAPIVLDSDDEDGSPRANTGRSSNEAIDLTGDNLPQPSIEPDHQPLSMMMQERQEFMEEMRRISLKSDRSATPPHPAASHSRPRLVREMRQELQEEIRKPLPASSVEIKFPSADQWDNGGSRYRTRFLLSSPAMGRTRGVSPGRGRAGRHRGVRRRGYLGIRGPVLSSRQDGRPAARNRRQQARVSGSGSPNPGTAGAVVDLRQDTPEDLISTPIQPSIDQSQDSQATRVNSPRTPSLTSPASAVVAQPTKSPTRRLFPDLQPFALDSTQETFPSPEPAQNVPLVHAVAAFHYPTPQLKRSRATNEQQTEVFHYPSPRASSSARPPTQEGRPDSIGVSFEKNRLQTQLPRPEPRAEPGRPAPSTAARTTPQAAFAYPKPSPPRLQVAKEKQVNKRPRLSPKTPNTTRPVSQNGLSQSTRPSNSARLTTPSRPRLGEDL